MDMLSAVQGLAKHRKKVAPTEDDFEALSVAAEFMNPNLQSVMVDKPRPEETVDPAKAQEPAALSQESEVVRPIGRQFCQCLSVSQAVSSGG